MRKIMAGLFTSLDGVVESPQQWQTPYFNDEMAAKLGAQMAASDTMLLGRRTYQEFAAHWPHQSSEVPFADHINTSAKLVVSTTLDTVGWHNSSLFRGDIAAQLRVLKQQPGKDITVTGSPTLVRSLLRDDLLDELGLLVCPVVVGQGARLFDGLEQRRAMKLLLSETFSNGVLSLTYEPVGSQS